MPTKKPPTPQSAAAAGTPEPAEMNGDREAEILEQVRQAFAQAPDDSWNVQVYQMQAIPNRAPREGWLFQCHLNELDELRPIVAQEHGPGRYRVRIRHNGFTKTQYDFYIAASSRGAGMGGTARSSGSSSSSAAGDIPPGLAAILENQNRLLAAIAERAAAPASVSAVSAISEALSLMTQMQAAIPKPDPHIGLTMFEKGLELANKLRGRDTETSILDVVREAVGSPLFAGAVSRALTPSTRPAAATIPARATQTPGAGIERRPAQTPQPTEPSAVTNPNGNGGMGMDHFVRDQIRYLVSKAREGADPQHMADWVLQNVAPQLVDQLGELPDPMSLILELAPEAGDHRAWFSSLIDNLFEAQGEELEQPGTHKDDLPLP